MQVREQLTLTGHLARFVSDLRYEDLPAAVVQRAKSALLDTLGAALGGVGTVEGDRALAAMQDCAPGTVLRVRIPQHEAMLPGAALINGTLAHARELDD